MIPYLLGSNDWRRLVQQDREWYMVDVIGGTSITDATSSAIGREIRMLTRRSPTSLLIGNVSMTSIENNFTTPGLCEKHQSGNFSESSSLLLVCVRCSDSVKNYCHSHAHSAQWWQLRNAHASNSLLGTCSKPNTYTKLVNILRKKYIYFDPGLQQSAPPNSQSLPWSLDRTDLLSTAL